MFQRPSSSMPAGTPRKGIRAWTTSRSRADWAFHSGGRSARPAAIRPGNRMAAANALLMSIRSKPSGSAVSTGRVRTAGPASSSSRTASGMASSPSPRTKTSSSGGSSGTSARAVATTWNCAPPASATCWRATSSPLMPSDITMIRLQPSDRAKPSWWRNRERPPMDRYPRSEPGTSPAASINDSTATRKVMPPDGVMVGIGRRAAKEAAQLGGG